MPAPSTAYRTAVWHDFVKEWGIFNLTHLGIQSKIHDNAPLQRTSTYTWVTGDQHLNNFGAWQNCHGDIVFGVNDFDEAIIYDFQMDVWRLGVSVYSQAIYNGLEEEEASAAVLTMCDSYVSTIEGYIGNEEAALFEISDTTATGPLSTWLREVRANQTHHKMLTKYTEMGADGKRKFKRNKKLRDVTPAFAEEVRKALNGTGYGATMMKIGWHARLWDPSTGGTAFQVVDVAQVIGAGVGSFGVGRYYVLLAAADSDHTYSDSAPDQGVILDVKYEPKPAGMSWPWLPLSLSASRSLSLSALSLSLCRTFPISPHLQLLASSTTTRRHGIRRNTAPKRHDHARAARIDVLHRSVCRLGEDNGSDYGVRQRSAWKASFDRAL